MPQIYKWEVPISDGHMAMPFVHFSCVLLACCLALLLYRKWYNGSIGTSRLPPSPPRHWFWGNKSFLNQPYRHVILGTDYKKQLGNIISVVTPIRTTVYVNTMELATELLEKQTATTSDRPRDVMVHEILGWETSVGFHKHDERHKRMRRILASALHPAAARSYAPQHLSTTLNFLRKVAENPTSFMEITNEVTGAFIMRLAYGYVSESESDPLLAMVHQAFQYLGKASSTYFMVNDFPILRYLPACLPGAGFQRFGKEGRDLRVRYANDTFNMVFEQVRDGRVDRASYASGLLESKGGINASREDIDLIKWTTASLFTAGSTTTAAVVNAFFLMLALHPEVAKEAQAEIDSVVGRERIPELHDRNSMPYMEAVLQEVMRMCPVVPLGLAHVATEDIQFHGYRIPKGATIHPNIWAILHDPNHYTFPHRFNPSRFMKSTPDPDPRKFIFGFGRRVCPGSHVANNSSWIMCAGVLSVFDIRASLELDAKVRHLGGRESDMLYELFLPFGLFGDALPFSCNITPRDSAAVDLLNNYA